MQKVYQRINWENEPSTKSPINDDNLNKMDYAIDQIDSRVVQLSGYEERVSQSEKNAKTSETNAKTSEINAKESEVKAKEYMEQAFKGTPEGYQEFLDKVDALEIKTTKENTIKGTKHGGFRFNKMLANTVQKQLSGKNLLPIASTSAITQNGVTFTPIYDASGCLQYVNVNGTATDNAYIVISNDFTLNAGTYTLSGCPSGGSYSTYRMYVNGGNAPTDYGDGDTFTLDEPYTYVNTVIYVSKGVTVSNLKFYPMISKEGGEYEPFCGGMASPNPSYPQPLLSTGDCVELMQGGYGVNDGRFFNVPYLITNKNPIPCSGGDTLVLSTDITYNYLGIVFYKGDNYVSGLSTELNSKTISCTVPSGADNFRFDIQSATTESITPQTAGKITITINGKYLGCAKTNKELFDGESESAVYNNATGVKVGDSGWCCAKNPIPCKSGEKVTIKHSFEVDIIRLFFYKTDGSFVGYKQPTTEGVTEFSAIADNDGYFIWAILDNVVVSPSTLGELSITSSMNETVAYYTTQYPMIKGSTLFRENGLVKVKHTHKAYTITGLEEIISGVDSGHNRFCVFTSLGENIELGYGMCSHFAYGVYPIANNILDNSICVYTNGHVYLRADQIPTVDELRTFLKNSSVGLMYKLATPIIETLDTDSQIALNGLETFDGVTHVEFDTRVQPLEFEAEVGTSQVGAYTLKSLNNSESNAVRMNELAVALVSL